MCNNSAPGDHRGALLQGRTDTVVEQCGNGKHHVPDPLEVYGDNTTG